MIFRKLLTTCKQLFFWFCHDVSNFYNPCVTGNWYYLKHIDFFSSSFTCFSILFLLARTKSREWFITGFFSGFIAFVIMIIYGCSLFVAMQEWTVAIVVKILLIDIEKRMCPNCSIDFKAENILNDM